MIASAAVLEVIIWLAIAGVAVGAGYLLITMILEWRRKSLW